MNKIIDNWKYGNVSIVKMEVGDKLYVCHLISEYVGNFATITPVGENTTSQLVEFFQPAILVVEEISDNQKTVQHVRYAMSFRPDQELNLDHPIIDWVKWELAVKKLHASKPTPVHVLGGFAYAICYADEQLVQVAKVRGSQFWLLKKDEVHKLIQKAFD